MEEKTIPPQPGVPPFIPLPQESPPSCNFDAAPLLKAVMADDGPKGVAESLDMAYSMLAEYLVSDPDTAGARFAHVLSDLRRMRDALLQGGGWFRL